ncbi:MAG: response regulator transcription factor [Chloroflexi bacterium]|nr:response regulator transcription factor [Chloroflexota bacterium]
MTDEADVRPIRVLIVDDHAVIAEALQVMLDLEPDISVVGIVKRGAEAASAATSSHADVVLMDVRLPDLDGIVAAEQIRQTRPEARVVVLTSLTDDDTLSRAATAGAVGYLSKDAESAVVRDAIRRAAAGEILIPSSVLSSVLVRLQDRLRSEREQANLRESLTEREREVLQAMASGADNETLADSLGVSPHTLRTHVQRILAKLSAHSKLEAVSLGLRYGLIQPPA